MTLTLLATILLTLPTHNVDGSLIPADEILVAMIWNTAKADPINVALGYPGQNLSMETVEPYGTWYATAWDINGTQSEPSESVSKVKPYVYKCGDGCHAKVIAAAKMEVGDE